MSIPKLPPSSDIDSVVAIYRSPGITAIYNELKSSRRNHVLDLGSASQSSLQFFSHLSCQFHFEGVDTFLAGEGVLNSGETLKTELENYLSVFDDMKKFDIILTWDIFNYLDQDTLQWLVTRLSQHCNPNTLLHTIKYLGRNLPATPRQHQVVDEYQIKTLGTNLICSRPFASLDTTTMLKHMPGYVMEQTFMQHEGMAQDITENVLRYRPDKIDSNRHLASAGLSAAQSGLPQYTEAHRSYGLEQMCALLKKRQSGRVLSLCSRATHNGDFFLEYAEQVYVEDIFPSFITNPAVDEAPIRQHALHYASDIKFDVIVAWDLFNFCNQAQLQEMYLRLKPHLHEATHIFAFFYAGAEKPERPQKCYVIDDKNIALLPVAKRVGGGEESGAGAVLNTFEGFHLANTYILRPGMRGGIYEYVFQAGSAIQSRP
jgi:hypothetical protein